jgi:hypothetical protein
VNLPPLIEAMRQPGFYPHRPTAVSLVQTHISYVFLADAEVYKVKKPVRFSFLDFSTLARRRHFCHEEVRLNRRLADRVYLGVVGIRPDGASFSLCDVDHPEAVEYAVRMRRLPEDRILTRLLTTGSVTAAMIDDLAERLVAFHRRSRSDEVVNENGRPEAVRAIIEENFAAVRPFRDRTIASFDDDRIQRFARAFLAREAELFARRQRQHRIREGHGDLHSEHICLTDPPVIFDCIEFNERFRYCDVASEIAFLAMDLDFHDQSGLAERLVGRYAALSADPDLSRLMPFYKCYRAYVRGKVDSLTSAEDEVEAADREAARTSARRHFALACRYAWADRPYLIAVGGLSGTGKSTVAAALADRTGFVHLSSDVIRKELAGLPADASAKAPYARDLYDREHTARTYRALLERAGRHLGAGRGVILDATFQRRADRDAVRGVARRKSSALLFVECRSGEDDVRRRLAARAGGPSDADWEVFRRQKALYEPFGAEEREERLELDTSKPLGEIIVEVECRLERAAEGRWGSGTGD